MNEFLIIIIKLLGIWAIMGMCYLAFVISIDVFEDIKARFKRQ